MDDALTLGPFRLVESRIGPLLPQFLTAWSETQVVACAAALFASKFALPRTCDAIGRRPSRPDPNQTFAFNAFLQVFCLDLARQFRFRRLGENMRVLGLVAAFSLALYSDVIQASSHIEFNRDLALDQHKEVCQLELSLSLGIGVGRHKGESRSSQLQRIEDNEAASRDTKEILLNIVDELYSVPKLRGGTYAFYRLESCLVHHWFDEDRGSVGDIAESLLECQSNTSSEDLEGLVACIDAELIRTRASK